MEVKKHIQICEKFSIQSYKTIKKKHCVLYWIKKDAFVSKKTGAGKSLCYQGFSTVFEGKCIVIVVSPLNSIMEEQCAQLMPLELNL